VCFLEQQGLRVLTAEGHIPAQPEPVLVVAERLEELSLAAASYEAR
jgi:hypothetical protein